MLKILILLFLGLIIFFAVKCRISNNKRRQKDFQELVTSPFSQALTQLLGIAGGIYLSLVLLISFLSIDIPGKINFSDWSIDPLALISLVIAVLQPFVLRLIQNIKLNRR